MSPVLEKYQLNYPALTPVASETQSRVYTAALLELETQDHLTAGERQYANVLAMLIEKYEKGRYPDAEVSPVEVIRELMEANGLRQKDLAPVLGGENVVSEVLNGKRELSKAHIRRLSERFGLSPAAFF